MTHIDVLRDRAVAAQRQAIAANVAADCILDAPVEPDDTWGADLRTKKYRAQLLLADAYREYAFMNRTALESALLADMEQADRRQRYDALPNRVSVPGRTLAEDVEQRSGGAA